MTRAETKFRRETLYRHVPPTLAHVRWTKDPRYEGTLIHYLHPAFIAASSCEQEIPYGRGTGLKHRRANLRVRVLWGAIMINEFTDLGIDYRRIDLPDTLLQPNSLISLLEIEGVIPEYHPCLGYTPPYNYWEDIMAADPSSPPGADGSSA